MIFASLSGGVERSSVGRVYVNWHFIVHMLVTTIYDVTMLTYFYHCKFDNNNNKKKKNNNSNNNTFRDFRVFDFGYRTKSKTQKLWKFSIFLLKTYLDLELWSQLIFYRFCNLSCNYCQNSK